MANPFLIHSVGDSLITILRDGYPKSLEEEYACEFRLLSSSEFAGAASMSTAMTLYLYNVDEDPTLSHNHPVSEDRGRHDSPLFCRLYYMVTVWAGNALTENVLIGWAISQFNKHPVLEPLNLSTTNGRDESNPLTVQLFNTSNREMLQFWDGIGVPYRLSFSCIVRGVRIA